MKKFILMALTMFMAVAVNATDVKTVTLKTNMSCENCASKIKENVRFEKGVKEIKTNVSDKTVTITYDADKTNPEKLIKGIEKVGYKASLAEGKHECADCKGDHKGGKDCCEGDKKDEKKSDCCSKKKN